MSAQTARTIHALVTASGTACSETALEDGEYTGDNRARIESQFCDESKDSPLAGSWADVSDNDAFAALAKAGAL